MKLVLEAKYPHPFKTKRDPGDAPIIYETGQRTTDIKDLKKAFDEVVEETEGKDAPTDVKWPEEEEADSWSVEVSLDNDLGTKKVPVTKEGTFPTEFNTDKKVLSEAQGAILKFKPTAEDVLSMVKEMHDETIKKQLLAMLFDDSVWISEICEMMGEHHD